MKALVVGIPRSGSTLLCRMINSVENCICLSEPHLEALSLRTYRTLRDQKVSDLELEMFADHEMPLDVAMSKLEEIFEVAAFKETFRPEPFREWGLFNGDLLNTYKNNNYKIIGIVRSPLKNFNSWKSQGWGNWTHDVDVFIESYRSILQFCGDAVIRYEDLIASPALVMKTLDMNFSKLKPMEAEFGDIEALQSGSVRREKENKSVVSTQDISAIERSGLMELYDSLQP